MNEQITVSQLFACETDYIKPLINRYEYPWEILPHIKGYIQGLIEAGLEGYTLLKEGVLVGQNVKIYDNTVIEAPAIIGSGTQIRPGAFLRGSVITGENCVIGNSTELKNCILLNKVEVPHYNYVGDSILGNRAHMGAGSVCSNLKSGGANVVIHADTPIPTGMRKVGGFLGDYADVGCGCVLNPGTVIGKHTTVYPLTPLRGIYPANSIVKAQKTVVAREER